MNRRQDAENAAVARLIAEIDALDAWRERVGRRIILLFLSTFAGALGLLFYIAAFEGAPRELKTPPGPRAAPVLRGARD
ncbi:MAG: hypothetical protein HXY18_07095 [Bryobacteraceae bacterium]|nr:hypothetical protein [Bryobacteraceae bacterium]